MVDVIGLGLFGRDDGIKCDICFGDTYLDSDQGGGLCGYTCDRCGYSFLVQYDSVDDYESDEEDYWHDFDEAGYPI